MKFTLIPQTKELHDIYQSRKKNITNRGDAGLDLVTPSDILIKPGERILLDLQVKVQLSFKCLFFKRYLSYILIPRSSIATNTPLMMINSIGLIDSSYLGTIKVPLINVSENTFLIKKGSRLVQLVTPNLSTVKTFDIISNEDFNRKTKRGQNGFGSTN